MNVPGAGLFERLTRQLREWSMSVTRKRRSCTWDLETRLLRYHGSSIVDSSDSTYL